MEQGEPGHAPEWRWPADLKWKLYSRHPVMAVVRPLESFVEQSSGDTSANAREGSTGFWSKYGCFVGVILPFVLAVPVWLLAFPNSYDHAVDFVVDAFAVVAFVSVASILGRSVVRNWKTVRPLGYLIILAAFGLAGLGVWNFVAHYTNTGIPAVTLFAWEYSGRPSFSALVVFGGVGLAAMVSVWSGKGRPPGSAA
jgi:hypothetical protein